MPMVIENIHKLFVFWLWVYLCNSIICFLYSPQGDIEVEALHETIRVSVLLFSFFIILQGDRAIHVSRLALIVVIIFSVIMNVVDFIMPLWSKVPGRGAGFYVNPTISGKMLVLMMVGSVPLIPQKIRLAYCVFVGVGVLVTFSRGPWFLWLIAVIGLSMTGYLQTGRKGISIIVVSFLSSFILYSVLTGGFLDLLTVTGTDEYLTRGTLARIGGSGSAFNDLSTETRAATAAKAWAVFAESPWLGAGLGHDQKWSVGAHNTYLRLAAEGGLFRLGVFIGFLVSLWFMTDNIGRIVLVVYAASSMTSHNNLQSPTMLVFLALIAVLSKKKSINDDSALSAKKSVVKAVGVG